MNALIANRHFRKSELLHDKKRVQNQAINTNCYLA